MTRGNVCIISNDYIYTSMQFNGDMTPDKKCGYKALELLYNIETEEDYENGILDFYEKNFKHQQVDESNLFRYFPRQPYFDFSEKYFEKFNSDYIYIKNISNKKYTIYDEIEKEIIISPNEILVFYYGDLRNIDIILEKIKKEDNLQKEEQNEDITFGDFLRSMNDEELAEYLAGQSASKNYNEYLRELKTVL